MRLVGVMSGTSVDGLDVAVLEVSAGAPRIVAAETVPLPDSLATALSNLATPGSNEIVRMGDADAALGVFIGETVAACLDRWGILRGDVRAIGCHGQTIRHHPDATTPFTVQIGDPNRIAEITGIDVVADLRRRDLAAGGEGAPLAPLFHEALFRDKVRHRVVVNVGGIANATMLPAASTSILGFDTGPGNALLDAWTRHCLSTPFDHDGTWSASGERQARLFDVLCADAFVGREPPKSTGKETYNLDYVIDACRGLDLEPADVQATLAEFTAWSIATSVRRWGPPGGDVVVCGGGRRNAHLMERLTTHLDGYDVMPCDDLDVDGDALEAAAFAWFAHHRLERRAGNAPAVTGASGPRVLGAVYAGQPP
ncbi:MAG: anhydro-N-acetylmuramic acid kinase [Gammaproteobacteria bacterium]|nr:anhydro-N-acetylmuramic acid kinase [Gammaproteobacteria bacterium]